MAKRRTSKKSTAPAPVKRRASRARTFYRSARSASRKSGMRWGEAILSALVGYEGGNLLNTPAVMLYDNVPQVQGFFNSAYTASGGSQTTGETANKTLGVAAAAKVAYDVIKHKRMDDTDKNILIPYVIGTVFDPAKSGASNSGGWK